MFLHHFGRPLAKAGFPFYFKKIFIIGDTSSWRDKPTLICANHPTGFFEPIIIGTALDFIDFRYITRGDSFQKPIYNWMLRSMGLVPIFRQSDGFEKLKKNTELLPEFSKLLSEKEKIIVFAEGSCKTLRQIRPLQKGLARIGFDAIKDYGTADIQIVPICCTYTDPHEKRSEAYINIGAPIPLSDYVAAHAENPAITISNLTRDLRLVMRKLIVNIDVEAREGLAQNFINLYVNTFPTKTLPVYDFRKTRRFSALQEIGQHVNDFSEDETTHWQKQTDAYFTKLKTLGLDDKIIAVPMQWNFSARLNLFLGYIPYLIGKYIHKPIMDYGDKYQAKVKRLEFKGPLYAVLMLGLGVGLYLTLLILSLFTHLKFLIGLAILMPFIGFYALQYNELRNKYLQKKVLDTLSPEVISALRTERAELLKVVFR